VLLDLAAIASRGLTAGSLRIAEEEVRLVMHVLNTYSFATILGIAAHLATKDL
jgi:hypothetical protein